MTDPSSDMERLARAYQQHLDAGGNDDPQTFLQGRDDVAPGSLEALSVVRALRASSRELPALRIGPYRLEEELGRGTQGLVFRAIDTRLGRAVALKLLSPAADDPAGFYLRFKREAESASRIEHPHVCTVYDAGVDEGRPYIAMQLVEGTPLSTWQPDETSEREALDLRLQLVERVASGLAAAHDAGLVHRDIKPGNIIVAEDGMPVLVDFGLARADTIGREALTRTGDLHGTPAYMAPEQIQDARRVEPRTDVYALGVVAYELIAGHRPFVGATLNELMSEIVRADPERPKGLARDVWTVIRTAMARDPAGRYASASAFADDLRRVRRREAIRAKPPGPLRRARQWTRRHPAVAVALVLIVGGALAFAAQRSAAARRLAHEKQQVDVARQRADRRAYLANIQAADASLANYDVAEATRRLQACPESMRGWEWRYLATSLDESHQRVHAHEGGVRDVALSADGSLLASVGRDGHLRRWSADTLEPAATPITDASAQRHLVAIAPDGQTIATAEAKGRITLWDAQGKKRETLAHHGARVRSLAFSPDGSMLISGDVSHALVVYDRSARQPMFEWPFGTGTIRAICCSSDSRYAVYGTPMGEVVRVDLQAHTRKRLIDVAAQVWDVAFTPGDRQVVLGLSDGSVRVIDVATGAEVHVFRGHRQRVTAVCALGDGRFASASLDGSVRVWDANPRVRSRVFVGHQGSVTALQWSPKSRVLFSGGADGSLRRWHLVSSWARARSEDSEPVPEAVSFHPDGRTVAVAGATGRVFVHDAWSGDLRARLMDHRLPVHALAHSADGRWMVSAGSDAAVRVWNASTLALQTVLRAPSRQLAVAVHPGGTQVAAGGAEGSIRSWQLATGQPLDVLATRHREITHLVYDPAGTKIAAVTPDGVSVHEVATRRRVLHLPGKALRVSYAPDGQRLAVLYRDHAVIHDATSGAVLHELRGQRGTLTAVRWHPTEPRIAIASTAPSVRLWDSEHGETVCVLRQGTSRIRDVRWSRDGDALAAVSSDCSLQIWRSSQPAGFLEAARARVRGIREAQAVIEEARAAQLTSPEAVAFVRRQTLSPAAMHAALHAVQRLGWRVQHRPQDGLPWDLLEKRELTDAERARLGEAARRVASAEAGRVRAMPSLALADVRLGRPASAVERLRAFEFERERLGLYRGVFYPRVVHALALLELGDRDAATRRMARIEKRWKALDRPSHLDRTLHTELREQLQSSDK